MKKLPAIALFLLLVRATSAQILFNGDFTLGTLFWGCNPETSQETLYGGSTTNQVAEVDDAAGLCQTITGLIPGHLYALSFNASRRTGTCPSPSVTNVNVSVSGVLSVVTSLANLVFGYSTQVYIFAASATSHTLSFSAGSGFGGSTCGMIIDNVSVSNTALPISLIAFSGEAENNGVKLNWSTVTESNNKWFELERSLDGITFTKVLATPSQATNGNSSRRLNYEAADNAPAPTVNYYRLKQVDYDGSLAYSHTIAIRFRRNGGDIVLYPNPNDGRFSLSFSNPGDVGAVNVTVLGAQGKKMFSGNYMVDRDSGILTISTADSLGEGQYHCLVLFNGLRKSIPILVTK